MKKYVSESIVLAAILITPNLYAAALKKPIDLILKTESGDIIHLKAIDLVYKTSNGEKIDPPKDILVTNLDEEINYLERIKKVYKSAEVRGFKEQKKAGFIQNFKSRFNQDTEVHNDEDDKKIYHPTTGYYLRDSGYLRITATTYQSLGSDVLALPTYCGKTSARKIKADESIAMMAQRAAGRLTCQQ